MQAFPNDFPQIPLQRRFGRPDGYSSRAGRGSHPSGSFGASIDVPCLDSNSESCSVTVSPKAQIVSADIASESH
jgi:hypothetical protein